MRTIKFSKGTYRGEIRTSDLYTPAYGNNYLDIAFVQESQATPSNVTIKIEGKNVSLTLPVRFSRLASGQLDGCFFHLEWFKYYAPQFGTQAVDLTIYADSTIVASLKYHLTSKRGEVLLNPKTIVMLDENENAEAYDRTVILDECYNVASTQFTKHWNELEMMVYSGDEFLVTGVGIGGYGRPIAQGFTSLTKSSDLFFEIQGTTIFDHATIVVSAHSAGIWDLGPQKLCLRTICLSWILGPLCPPHRVILATIPSEMLGPGQSQPGRTERPSQNK